MLYGMTFHKDQPESSDRNKAQPIHDVIVSGAGPVGLFLACELVLAGCSVLVLEKAEHPQSPLKQLPFGLRGLNALSVQALHRRGLLDQLEAPRRLKGPHANATTGPRRQVGHFAGIPLLQGHIDTAAWSHYLPDSTPTSLIAELEELETVLATRADALGVHIQRGTAVTGLRQDQDKVLVTCSASTFQARWLVGCDGARSIVRKLGGFAFEGTEPEFTGYSARADLADPEKLAPGRVFTPTGMYLQSQPGYLVLQDFDGGAFHASGEPVTPAHLQAVLRRVSGTGVTVSALHIATTWTDRARQATTYRNGRVLLAGDAAHIHAPLGGQGLNLGLGDAMNLGWKLAATLRGHAPEGLLDSYQAERHPVGASVLDWSRAQATLMKLDPGARALHAIFRELMQTRDVATYVAGRLWGLTTRYDLGDDHPLVGQSAPDFDLQHGTRLSALLHSGKGMLLDFCNNSALQALAAEYDEHLQYVPSTAKEQLGLTAVLIRPDGFVAWASEATPNPQSIRHAANRWFARTEAQ